MSDTGTGAAIPTMPDAGAGGMDAGTATALPDFNALITEAGLSDRKYLADVSKSEKPFLEVLKQLDNAQTMLGRKTSAVEIPGEGATEEQIKNFYKALGVPDSIDGYEYKLPDVSSESEAVQKFLNESAKNDTLLKTMKETALKMGVPPKAFNEFAKVFDAFQVEQVRSFVEAQDNRAKEIESKFNSYYGDKADYVKRVAKETVEKVLPKEIREIGDPDVALFEAMRYIHEKVFKGDTIAPGASGSAAPTIPEIEGQILKLRSDEAFRNKMHPQHEEQKAKVMAMYRTLQQAEAEAKANKNA